jgi:hypothetical protein
MQKEPSDKNTGVLQGAMSVFSDGHPYGGDFESCNVDSLSTPPHFGTNPQIG